MTVYIVSFVVSILLIYYSEAKRFYGVSSKVSVFIALMIPCLVAGLRDYTIGTDVQVYAEPTFLLANSAHSFGSFISSGFQQSAWEFRYVRELGVSFAIVTYISAKIFHSFPVFLFIIQLITIVPIYKGLRAFDNRQPVWLGMAVYYLMFFNQSLNMMRQWIAMAILFYAFQFLCSKTNKKYFFFVIIASSFHTSALLGISIYFIHQLVVRKNDYMMIIKILLLIFIGIVSLLSLDALSRLLSLIGLEYSSYISGSLQFMPNQLLYRILIFLLLLCRWKYLKRTENHTVFYFVMIIYDILLSQLTSINEYSGRICLFFSEYYLLVYPSLCMAFNKKYVRRTVKLLVLCYLAVYWWYTYVYTGRDATFPYVSIFN